MASLTGPVYVPAPNPIVPRYGIFRVATGPLDLPVQARSGGVQYELSTCDLPLTYEMLCQADRGAKSITGGVDTLTALPFVVYSAVRCGTVGLANWGQERVNKFLYEQLIAGEQAAVENSFSTSAFGVSPGLGGNPNVVNLGTAQGVIRATGMLESWLYARYGLPGVIHAPMIAAPYFSGSHDVSEGSDGVWRTDVLTKVSFGNYAGTGPTGQVPADGTTWLYITGQVAIWRTPDSDLFVPPMGQVINRSTNVVTIVMEREYVVSFDCYIAAVQVTLDTTDR
jgi:hypothetical protein